MRPIEKIIVHCSATPPHMDIGANEIQQWHIERGFSGIGYHFVIRRNGDVEIGRPVEVIGAHTRGHNSDSIGICLVGGNSDADFTYAQYKTLVKLIEELQDVYGRHVSVHGHRDFADKACPCFNVQELLS